jgi:GGDEF domain-containing protein
MVLLALIILLGIACAALGAVSGAYRRQGGEIAELRVLARVEGGTLLRTSSAFGEDLHRELLRSDRTGRPVSIAVISLGSSGEAAASFSERRRQIGLLTASALRQVDAIYRVGAGEIALILPETRAEPGKVAVGRVLGRLAGTEARARAGIAEAGPGIDRHELFRHAYTAMLAADPEGIRRALVYSPELERRAPAAGDALSPR